MILAIARPEVARRRARASRQSGFSLIELMVVVAIMGLLATVVALNLMGQTYKAKVVKVQTDFKVLRDAIDMFKLNTGRYPQRLEDLWTQPGGVKNWAGPYIKDAPPAPKDPWSNDYIYTPPLSSSNYLITSYGADGAPGGVGENQDLTTANINQIDTNTGQ
ncbi:type II secretion system major pseudopilin GspG [bacterium]|nr:type II secretion system major pseudopilin GspG [bacterium]